MNLEDIKTAAVELAAQLAFDPATGEFKATDKQKAEEILLNATGVTADELKKARAATTHFVAITTRALQEVAPAQFEKNKELKQVSVEVDCSGYTLGVSANTAGRAPGQDGTVTTIRHSVTGQYSPGNSAVTTAKDDLRAALAAYQ